MSRIIVLMIMISTVALASSAENAGTDIIQRTVNFLLFAGLIWYLVAEPVKNYFASRSQAIADEMKKVQDKLKETGALKKEAVAKITDAEKFAEELAISSKKENKILNDNIIIQCGTDLEILAKQQVTLMDFEQRKMVRSVVEETLDEVLSQSSDSFDKEAMANVILKKVA
ncbi:MAG: F0F1 ATP synthase subunit B [Sulfurimonas sp.]|nr:F0F1 ATP synthase subunit B [Sulfurimonas sp.]